MKTLKWATFILLCITIVSCKGEKNKNADTENDVSNNPSPEPVIEEKDSSKTLKISLSPKSDSNVTGTVFFTETNGIVKMKAELIGLSEGEHAIHIHEKADCSSEDGKSTGGHWNPTLESHGKWGDQKGYHKGDIGNFNSNAEGKGFVSFETDEWCIGCDDDKRNIIGKAIIVHQGIDDYASQPSGAAGSRISCGGIIQ